MSDDFISRPLLTDSEAASASGALSAFLARPSDAPVYHGFPLIPETETDGWTYGAITDFCDAGGCDWGDGFVVAPDGTRAGIVWTVGTEMPTEIYPPTPGRWGVYAVCFPKVIRTLLDMVECFRSVLPDLQSIHARLVKS